MIPAAQRSPLTCRPALGSHQAQAEEKGPPAIHALCPVSSKNQLPTWKSACRHHHGTLTKGVWLTPQLGRATSYGTLGSPALKKLRLREQGVPLCMRLPEARSRLLRDPRAFGNACPLQLCETVPCLSHSLSGGHPRALTSPRRVLGVACHQPYPTLSSTLHVTLGKNLSLSALIFLGFKISS